MQHFLKKELQVSSLRHVPGKTSRAAFEPLPVQQRPSLIPSWPSGVLLSCFGAKTMSESIQSSIHHNFLADDIETDATGGLIHPVSYWCGESPPLLQRSDSVWHTSLRTFVEQHKLHYSVWCTCLRCAHLSVNCCVTLPWFYIWVFAINTLSVISEVCRRIPTDWSEITNQPVLPKCQCPGWTPNGVRESNTMLLF